MSEPNLPTRMIRRLTSWTHRFDDTGTKRDRALQLVGVVLGTGALFLLIDWLTNSGLFENLLFPDLNTTPQVQAWSARVYAAVLILGLPVAFMLWHWRDRNVRDGIEEQRKQVENARKDTNLKEFQEVQLRAAGALDEKLPQEAREQLQIAALHQLRGFLRGDYGESFKRPAFELLLAGHAAAVHRIGVPEVQAQIPVKSGQEIADAIRALRTKLNPIDLTRMLIIRDEGAHIFTLAYPLDGRRFDLLDLSGKMLPTGLLLNLSHFFGTSLSSAHLKDAELRLAQLEGANLWDSHLEGARLAGANFEGADMGRANLVRANFSGTHLEGVNLNKARLEGAEVAGASFAGTNLMNATFDDSTQFFYSWQTPTPEDIKAAQDRLRALGARHVND